jgi:hypothetical protein
MKNAKLYINHKLYDISRGLLDWAVRKQHWKLVGRISGWRNRLVEPILQDLHSRLIIPAPTTPTVKVKAPVKTKASKAKK